MSKNIKVYVLCNSNTPEILKTLSEYVPKPPSCSSEVKTASSLNIADILDYDPDIIFQYGLGNGLFWQQEEQLLGEKLYKVINDDHTYEQLFYTDKYMYSSHFNKLKEIILDLDLRKSWPERVKIAKTKEDLDYIVNRCMTEPFGLDTETNFLNPFVKSPTPKMLCFSIAWLSDEDEGWCIPTQPNLLVSGNCSFTLDQVNEATKQIFFETPQPMMIHNAAYDLLVMFELFNKRQPKNFFGDTMILLNLYHHAGKSASLKNNTDLIHLPAYKEPIKDWIEEQYKKNKEIRKATKAVKGQKKLPAYKPGYDDVPLDIIGPYAALDAIAVVRIFNFLKKNMATSLWKFYYKVPHRVIKCANELCCEGYTISRDRYNYTKFNLEEQIINAYDDALSSVKDDISKDFNIASPQQLGKLLFSDLKLPVFNKTDKGKAATSQKALDDLILFHPFIFKLSKYRKLTKLYSTYVVGYAQGVLNEGSTHYKRTGNWTINAQYKQTNRTARLGNTNFSEHNGMKKRGGNVLVLPAQGSMIKQYFLPREIAEQENILYDKIVSRLSEEDRKKLKEAEAYNIKEYVKPEDEEATVSESEESN